MLYENLITEINGGIFTITVNREEKMNALNKKTIEEIGLAIGLAETEPAAKVIIITGAGKKAFVAGADISEFAGYDASQGEMLASKGHAVFNSIERSTKPVIAAVNGFALGGGCELAMACHFRLASENARFGQPEVKLGLIPGYGGTQRLTRLIGRTRALELLMTADMISAQQALACGLINAVTPPDQLLAACSAIAAKLMDQAPLALAGIIRCVNAFDEPGADGMKTEIQEFGRCFITSDFKEGTAAFLGKRKASFKGE